MTNLNLFSEIYGCYFTVVKKIIKEAKEGATRKEIEELIQSNAFYDSAFQLMPKIFSSEWNFLEERANNKYYTKSCLCDKARPLTNLEKSWLKAILLDKRILLFLTKEELEALQIILKDTEPLFKSQNFHVFDSAKDGDPYQDENYYNNFRTILRSCQLKRILKLEYESVKKKRLSKTIVPYRIIYSNKDDKFRLLGVLLQNGNRYKEITLNIARVRFAEITELQLPSEFDISKHIGQKIYSEPILLSISTERNALERCMLQFASWEKETEYDEENKRYICKIYYDKQDETELLIRVLSFGPVIKVLGHKDFLNQIKERIFKQHLLNGNQIESKK